MELKGRGCRERLDKLIEKFRAVDTRSLKMVKLLYLREVSILHACLNSDLELKKTMMS